MQPHLHSTPPPRRSPVSLTPAQRARLEEEAKIRKSHSAPVDATGPNASTNSQAEFAGLRPLRTHSAEDALEFFDPTTNGGHNGAKSARTTNEERTRSTDADTLSQFSRSSHDGQHKREDRWRGRLQQLVEKGRRPSDQTLVAVVKNAFSCPMDIPVLICDVKANSGDFTLSRLGDIENCT